MILEPICIKKPRKPWDPTVSGVNFFIPTRQIRTYDNLYAMLFSASINFLCLTFSSVFLVIRYPSIKIVSAIPAVATILQAMFSVTQKILIDTIPVFGVSVLYQILFSNASMTFYFRNFLSHATSPRPLPPGPPVALCWACTGHTGRQRCCSPAHLERILL